MSKLTIKRYTYKKNKKRCLNNLKNATKRLKRVKKRRKYTIRKKRRRNKSRVRKIRSIIRTVKKQTQTAGANPTDETLIEYLHTILKNHGADTISNTIPSFINHINSIMDDDEPIIPKLLFVYVILCTNIDKNSLALIITQMVDKLKHKLNDVITKNNGIIKDKLNENKDKVTGMINNTNYIDTSKKNEINSIYQSLITYFSTYSDICNDETNQDGTSCNEIFNITEDNLLSTLDNFYTLKKILSNDIHTNIPEQIQTNIPQDIPKILSNSIGEIISEHIQYITIYKPRANLETAASEGSNSDGEIFIKLSYVDSNVGNVVYNEINTASAGTITYKDLLYHPELLQMLLSYKIETINIDNIFDYIIDLSLKCIEDTNINLIYNPTQLLDKITKDKNKDENRYFLHYLFGEHNKCNTTHSDDNAFQNHINSFKKTKLINTYLIDIILKILPIFNKINPEKLEILKRNINALYNLLISKESKESNLTLHKNFISTIKINIKSLIKPEQISWSNVVSNINRLFYIFNNVFNDKIFKPTNILKNLSNIEYIQNIIYIKIAENLIKEYSYIYLNFSRQYGISNSFIYWILSKHPYYNQIEIFYDEIISILDKSEKKDKYKKYKFLDKISYLFRIPLNLHEEIKKYVNSDKKFMKEYIVNEQVSDDVLLNLSLIHI